MADSSQPQPRQQQQQQQQQNKNNKKTKKAMKTAAEKNEEKRLEELLVGACVPVQLKSLGGHTIHHYSQQQLIGQATTPDLYLDGGTALAANFMNEEYILRHVSNHMRDLEVHNAQHKTHPTTMRHTTPQHVTPHHTTTQHN